MEHRPHYYKSEAFYWAMKFCAGDIEPDDFEEVARRMKPSSRFPRTYEEMTTKFYLLPDHPEACEMIQRELFIECRNFAGELISVERFVSHAYHAYKCFNEMRELSDA